ncbi:MAG: transketolase [Anaerolineales bacterium]|jgi:transketolase|nr:transketolase [Anaerolineales bacterium]MDX9937774.1 transketolase [Anaerolineales bacterium]WKZ52888.1 MAG: transketolase [Anaerolineales bacterium]GER79996.1 transketolase [Candidatus Denitrolinea symbiosum]
MTTDNLETRAINTIRFLSADAVQQANSGHPGLPMGAAAMAFVVWTRHLRHNPHNPKWAGRDRFLLSGGHGSMLLYSLLHLTGYSLPLDELKNFRQWGSRTPGHPEYGLTPGVEMTTGPLGQGFATGVGMAIASTHLAAVYSPELFDNFIYAIVTDGDLMEGVASEAASLAGHLQLGRLIYLYDDNHISIDGSTNLAFTEDRGKRFEAYGWHVQHVADGNDVEAIDAAIRAAKADPRPSIIMCRTIIGFGAPKKQGTSKAHGEPLGNEELNAAKENLNWPKEPRFYIPDDVLDFYREAVERGHELEAEWNKKFSAYKKANPDKGVELERRLAGVLPKGWTKLLPIFPADAKGMATRAASGKVINALAPIIPELLGGSADLAPSNNTRIDGLPDFQKETPQGRNFHFGVREHAMAAALNGMALFGGLIPYGGTFLVFSDYNRPAIRIAALSHTPSIFVFTHDSIGLGEDGPTHQPVDQLAALRAMPNLTVIRPADANETAQAWKVALENRRGPTVLALTRQSVPTFPPSSQPTVEKGAYVLAHLGRKIPDVILMASGSEVSLVMDAAKALHEKGHSVRVVSFPCWELFEKQDEAYRESVLPKKVAARVAIEAGVGIGWERYVGAGGRVVSIERFGASAPYKVIYEKFGLTVENVIAQARAVMPKPPAKKPVKPKSKPKKPARRKR